MVAALLIANLLVASPAPVLKSCETLPSPLRVRMTVATSKWKITEPTIRRLVEDTWAPAGLRIEWVSAGEGWDGIDFWIAVVHGMPTTDEGGALGLVLFAGDKPRPMARISIDAALIWARRHQARRLGTSLGSLKGADVEDPEIVGRVLGYSAAHELGHFVLARKTHASSGVMRATYRDPWELFEAAPWLLDDPNRARLQQRMIEGCGRQPTAP